jgi:phage gpG-like protein
MAFDFKSKIRKFEQLKRDLPKKISNDGQRFFLKNFDNEQWEGKRWRPRIAYRNLSKRGQRRNITRKLLVNTGTLRRAVSGSRREATFNRIRFEVYVQGKRGFNYSTVHNEGIGRMPKRKFMGYNKEFNRIVLNTINRAVSAVMR